MSSSVYAAIPVMLVLSILQTAMLPHFSFLNLSPQLPLLVALAWGLWRGMNEGIVWGFVGGLCMDLLSITPFGVTAVAYMIAITTVLWIQEALPTSRLFIPVVLAALSTIVYLLSNLLLLRLLGIISSFQVTASLWPLILLNALTMLPVYWLLYAVDRTIRPKRVQL